MVLRYLKLLIPFIRNARLNCGHGLVRSYMPEDLRNLRWFFDAGDDP
jgi:hypothetical protein